MHVHVYIYIELTKLFTHDLVCWPLSVLICLHLFVDATHTYLNNCTHISTSICYWVWVFWPSLA